MAGTGGARPGAGRKTASEELRSAEICRSALIKKFGSLEAAIKDLIKSEEPVLVKFVYEHAFGKPQDKMELTGKNVTIKVNAE